MLLFACGVLNAIKYLSRMAWNRALCAPGRVAWASLIGSMASSSRAADGQYGGERPARLCR